MAVIGTKLVLIFFLLGFDSPPPPPPGGLNWFGIGKPQV
jgi:hypothetical protein